MMEPLLVPDNLYGHGLIGLVVKALDRILIIVSIQAGQPSSTTENNCDVVRVGMPDPNPTTVCFPDDLHDLLKVVVVMVPLRLVFLGGDAFSTP